jgi:adenosylcobinamide-GDP ribazoletransferase
MRAARPSWRSLLSGCGLAVSFLTIVPVKVGGRGRDGLDGALAWFPLIGALIGALAGAVRVLAQPLLGVSVASALALVALVGLTGALHQDGLADSADGLGAGGDRERRLAAMRDASVGAFGALALLGWALLLLTALESLSDVHALRALIAAAALARWAALLHAAAVAPARAGGLGASFRPPRAQLALASGLAVAVAELACGPLAGLAAIGAALLTAALSAAWARQALGGRSGDTLGATIALTEVALAIALVAVWHG